MTASSLTAHSDTLAASLRCDLAEVRPLAVRVRDFLLTEGVNEEDVMSCELALVEACNNAILYAPEATLNDSIEVEIKCTPVNVRLQVHDRTLGFDWDDQASLPENEHESGRGLYIIKSIMDEVTYHSNGVGNTLSMIKCRTKKPGVGRAEEGLGDYKCKLAENEQVIREMTEELSSCYETLSAIFRCGAELGKNNNIASFAKSLCTDLLHITESDWYVLRIVSEGTPQLIAFAASESSG
ncbi:MAG: ATP-binding protein, partial [Limisphaerales bacterium]